MSSLFILIASCLCFLVSGLLLFQGKMGIGRVVNGIIKSGDEVAYGKPGEPVKKGKINEIFVFNNVGREKVEVATAGDIVMMTGISDITIGDTVMSKVRLYFLPVLPTPLLSFTHPTAHPRCGRTSRRLCLRSPSRSRRCACPSP